MSKHTTPLIFNFSEKTKNKSTPSKKSTLFPKQNENQPPQFYSKMKRNFTEMENASYLNVVEGASKNMRLSLPKVPSILSDQSKRTDSKKIYPQIISTIDKKLDDPSDAFNQLDKFLYLDEKFSDHDKFSFKNPSLNFTQKNRVDYFSTLNKVIYPEIIISKYKECIAKNKEVNIINGLYEDLNIIYLTFENEIYIWDFITNQVICFKEISNPVTCLHITKPKYGVFSEEINHIIIVATENEIYILLLKINDDKIQIILSDYILDLNTNYLITYIVSTFQRRIFLGSQNNYIFELEYYNTNISTFFRAPKKLNTIERSREGILNKLIPPFFYNLKTFSYYVKIVVDNTRNVLYALKHYISDNSRIFDLNSVNSSEIEIYDLGVYGNEFKKKGVLKQDDIKKNYFYSSHFKSDKNYIISEIFEITRADSKQNNLLAITISGLRAFIKLDFNEEDNKIKKSTEEIVNNFSLFIPRPSSNFNILISPIADYSKSMRIEKSESKNDLTELIQYKQFFSFGSNLFSFFSNSFNNFSSLEFIQYDESIGIKSQLDSNFDNNLLYNENVTNLFNFRKEKINISGIRKIPYRETDQNLLKLMRFTNEETKQSKFINYINKINYKDSNSHFSNICMHSYSNQQFLGIEKYIILTTSEVITIGKVRHLDRLYEILKENNQDESEKLEKFISENSIFETAYMFLVIICNKNHLFFERVLSSDENVNDKIIEKYNSPEIIKKARNIYLELISRKYHSKKVKDEGNSFSILIGQAISEKTLIINHISYSFYMYLARICRLFWEENIFTGDPKVFIDEPLKIKDFTYLIACIQEFIENVKEMKNEILVKTNDYYNALNQTDEKSTSEFISFQNDIEHVIILSSRLVEVLRFIQSFYNFSNIRKHLDNFDPEIINSLFSIKYKDIIRNPKDTFIKQWIEEYFEIVYSEKDSNIIRSKLNDFNQICPSIISKADVEAIVASILIKFARTLEDDIQKQNTLNQAIDIVTAFPESIRLDKLNKILNEMNEILMIIRISCEKAIFLRKLLEKENINYDKISSISSGGSQYLKSKPNCYNDFKECLFYIFRILTDINNSIKSSETNFEEESTILLTDFFKKKNLTTTAKCELLNQCISEVLRHDDKFLHNLLFEHLNSIGMLDNISNFKSPYIENYLNNLLEIDKSDYKKHESLFKYFYKSNDYENAFNKALTLTNFTNNEMNNNYIRLNERKNYSLLALNCIEILINSEKIDETNKNEKIKLKTSLLDNKSILFEQISIYEQLLSIYNQEKDIQTRELIERDLFLLDFQKFKLDDLFNIAKKYGLFDIIIEILFLMNKINDINFLNSLTKSEISFFYECNFKQKIHSSQEYPKSIIPTLNLILSKNSEVKNKQISEKLFPLSEVIERIENLNFQFFDLQLVDQVLPNNNLHDLNYEKTGIAYWFVLFLYVKLEMSFFQIFQVYNDLLERKLNNLNEMIHIYLICILLYIIILWSVNVEKYNDKLESMNKDMMRLENEKDNLIREKNLIKLFFEKISKEFNSKVIKLMINQELCQKILTLISFSKDLYFNILDKLKPIGTVVENTKLNFTFKEPTLNEINIKRISANEMFTLDSLIDKSQSFKSLIQRNSNSQNPVLRSRNILEEED